MGKVSARWTFMPYCIKRLHDGRYVVLNRRSKPLGIRGHDHVSYEDHPSAARITITKEDARKMSHNGSDDLETIYLYHGPTTPTKDEENLHGYMDRLNVFMKLWVEEP